MHVNRQIRCDCCELTQTVRVDDNDNSLPTTCTPCQGHRFNDVEMQLRRHAEHAGMYHERMVKAEGEASRQYDRAEDYRERMKGAYRSREMVVRVLSKIHDDHFETAKGCSCRQRNCNIAKVIYDEKIHRLIRKYDDEQENLRQSRREDEERWVSEWDRIEWDTDMISPPRPAKQPPTTGTGTG